MQTWITTAILFSLVALHNAQRMAPVTLFDELRLRLATDYIGVGNLFGAYLLTYALFNIPAGILADRIDNKHLMATGAALGLLGASLFAVAKVYPVAISARLGLGVAGALLYVPAVRHIVTSFPKQKRGSVMGLVEAGAGTGMVVSLTVLPFLAERFDVELTFLMLSVLAAFVLGSVLLGLPSSRWQSNTVAPAGIVSLVRNGRFWHLIVYHFLGMLATYAAIGWLPTFIRVEFAYSAFHAGLVSTLMTIGLAVLSPVAGVISDRLGARTPVLLFGSVLSVLCFTLFLFSRDPKVVMAGALLAGVSMAFTIPVLLILVGETFGQAGAGLVVSMAGTAGQISSSISGFVFGYALQASGTFTAVWGLALILSAGRIPFLLWTRE